jgi:hypothetical protein
MHLFSIRQERPVTGHGRPNGLRASAKWFAHQVKNGLRQGAKWFAQLAKWFARI